MKKNLLEAMKDLPQDFDLDQLMEKLVFMEKVEKGLIQLEQGKTTPHDKVEEMTKKLIANSILIT